MKDYIDLFVDKEYPFFLDKYFHTKTLGRLKHITQFCGCDYTKLYRPLFLFSRYDHSLVVAHMTWHFTHDKKETVAALLHDVGTPCFAHCIDYVFGDYLNQESSEQSIWEVIQKDAELCACLEKDGLSLDMFQDYSVFPILENKSPKLCTDRLDGVLHTCFIWLHTHSLKQIEEVYQDMIVLTNEQNQREIGFATEEIAEKFVEMVHVYAQELQTNRNKYVMNYISELVKLVLERNYLTIADLYTKKEEELCAMFAEHFSSWKIFQQAEILENSDRKPKTGFYVAIETKKRNTIPLVKTASGVRRIADVSRKAQQIYKDLANYRDKTYAFLKDLQHL